MRILKKGTDRVVLRAPVSDITSVQIVFDDVGIVLRRVAILSPTTIPGMPMCYTLLGDKQTVQFDRPANASFHMRIIYTMVFEAK